MSKTIRTELTEYYLTRGIHPEHFNCPNQAFCRKFAHKGKMTETKMSLVGSRYGDKYPRIVVLSLDPPLGEKGNFIRPKQRTTAYVAAITEAENYTENRPKVHWAMTQILVKDILCLFGYKPIVGAAVVQESYANRPIENITPYFAHVNAAKCSMNKPDKGQANPNVHAICSRSYLRQELEILQPQILISQGKSANQILSNLLDKAGVEDNLPQVIGIRIGITSILWLPMDHPSHHTSEIRQRWPYYIKAIQKWATKSELEKSAKG